MAEDEGLKILASPDTTRRITRRMFLAGSAVSVFGGSVLLAACGNGNGGGSGGNSGGGGSGGSGGSSSGPLEDQLNFYHWAEYDDPKLFKKFTEELGPTTQIDIYASNEEMIAKLSAAQGTAGYDIVVPTGVYIPLMVSKDLLEELDLSRIPNFKNLDPKYTNQPWDPGNKHSVCKDWGTTGWIVDKQQIPRPINTWQDFIDVGMNEASGNVSVLDAPNEISGLYFWANGIDWTTTAQADLDAYENFIVDQFAPHIKAFDSYPGIALTQGNYALSQVWNGDARQGLLQVDDPSRYAWGLGAPDTELWMDNWAIVKGAEHPNAAYAWINFILDEDNSLQDLAFHGYNTGLPDIQQKAEQEGLKFLDMVFFTPDQVATMHAGAVNSAFDRLVDIYNKAKAAAGG
jgi:spermidine/putrescine transport system substrate-binding protein